MFEVHYLNNLVSENQWDNVYHEHIYYYSLSALNNFFTKYGMTVVDFEEIPDNIQDRIHLNFDGSTYGDRSKILNYFITKKLVKLVKYLEDF